MATLAFDGVDDRININPLSTSLNNIPNGPCTLAALVRRDSAAAADSVFGLRGGSMTGDFYHGLLLNGTTIYNDDDGTGVVTWATGPTIVDGAGGDNFFIVVIDWGSSAAVERIHVSSVMSAAESWSHQDSDGANAGNRAGPGTGTGYFHIGNYDAPWVGDIALVAVWAGTRFSDANAEALWVNKQTSDWYNHPAGLPDTLIELTSTSPTDIGADPVSSITVSGATAAGADPTGWTFDGQGAKQTLRPDADIVTTGWATAPLWSKIEEEAADGTVITATAG